MNKKEKSYFIKIQIVVWGIIYLLLLFYGMHKWEQWEIGFLTTTIYSVFYLVAIYTQSSYLAKYFLQKGSYTKYILLSVSFLIATVILRMYVNHVLLYLHFNHNTFYSFTNPSNFSFVLVTQLLASSFGVLFRITLNYLALLQHHEKLKVQQLQSELNLLKSQVQPHFLFNTLNNIYYLAHTKSEKTKDMIAKLSEMMRYFLEEVPKEKVLLSTEIQFIKDYICLEKIRIPHEVQIDFCMKEINEDIFVPPMLLMPLVENVFKHGIDKVKNHNQALLDLSIKAKKLRFEVINDIQNIKYKKKGIGLKNLRKRLDLLYGENYILENREVDGKFKSVLEIKL